MKTFLFALLNLLCLQNLSSAQDTLATISDSVSIVNRKKLKVNLQVARASVYVTPAILLGYGFLSLDNTPVRSFDKHIHHEIVEGNPNFKTHLDNNLRYVPVLAVYSLNLLGIKGQNNLFESYGNLPDV